MVGQGSKAVDEIIKDLNRIPRRIDTVIPIKKIADEVSKIQQRQIKRRIS